MTHASAVVRTGAVMPRESATWDADSALEQLYAAHWRQLVRLSVLLVRDVATAEEVVQDAFVAVHGRWSKLRDHDKALAYLRQTVVNRSRSALRHRAVVTRHAAREAVPRPQPGADEAALATDRRGAVLDAMRELPDRQREVLALRYYLDLSEAEIADALGISRGAVKSHASRGSATLRTLLSDYLEERS
jgi:RNA polymerase sigma-70 factor (sigma-E family)